LSEAFRAEELTVLVAEGLRFEAVGKDYSGHRALDNLHLEVNRGEFLTLLGPSGSGKTTTLMIAAGLTPPSSGRVLLGSRDITNAPPYQRSIGVVFQNYALFPHRTVEQNIAFPLRMRKVSREEIRSKVSRALELVRLAEYGARYPSQLSGGQQQRVALARAVVFEPELVLMDEPLGALDRKLRNEMQVEIKRLHEDLGLTVIYVTHDQEEALSMSDRIAVMRDGVIEQLDTPPNIYMRPRTAFVASFLGDTSLINGRVVGSGSEARLAVEGETPFPLGPSRYPDGAEVMLALRAEKVAVETGDSPVSPSNGRVAVQGIVESAIYLGAAWRYEVVLAGGQRIRGMCSENGATIPARGDAVTACWSIADGQVMEDDGR
jgi:putative spermidine/putrescine transport system ATP-binding protein